MNSIKVFVCMTVVFLTFAFFCPLEGQTKGLKFRGIEIPYTLKHKDVVIEKGKYDLEVMMPETSGIRIFYLRILKKNKALCIIEARKLHYKTEKVSELHKDPNIPDKPRLTMRRVKALKKLYIFYESGKHPPSYPFEKLRFEIDYIE
ncbi:hypothetical protein ACFLT2_04345 [Acidobacteriota bacterium]